jgi:glycosyltransferase involved in cell wall biosynthesis
VNPPARRGLVLDLQGVQSPDHGRRGIGRYVADHARALVAAVDGGRVRAMLLNPYLPFPGHLPLSMVASPDLHWNTATQFRRAERTGAIAYHVMSPFEFSGPRATVVPEHSAHGDIPLVVTLYDLIPLGAPDRYLADPVQRRRYLDRLDLIREADLVLAISEWTRQDAIRELGLDGARVVTIGTGVSPFFGLGDGRDEAVRLLRQVLPAVQRRVVLCVSGADDRKNTERLIEAYASLPDSLRAGHQLVIVCSLPPVWAERWHDVAHIHGLAPGELVLTGRVDDPVLRALYQVARLLVCPSLYEGFGMPVAEAIACGCPAITSSTSSLPSILELPASTFDPTDAGEMAALLERALADDGFRELLIETARQRAGEHTWAGVAQRTLDALDHLPDKPEPAPARRLRIAIAGPMPPTASGIADYNARLIGELARRCDLDVLLPTSEVADGLSESDARHLPLSELGRLIDAHSYDALIWTVGNSPHHFEIFEAMQAFPGVAWLHDVRLAGFQDNYERDRHPLTYAESFAATLRAQYGPRVPAEVLERPLPDAPHLYGLGVTRDWVRNARAVIVNSAFAAQLLAIDQGPDGPLPPVWTLPPAVGTAAAAPPPPPPIPVVGVFGIVHPYKACELLLDALPAVHAATGAGMMFVGECSAAYERELRAHAAQRGIAEHVHFTGRQSAPDYAAWFRRVTCAAQLRLATNGESSAAIRDAMAAGLAVITNVLFAAQDFGDAVVALPPDCDVAQLSSVLITLISDEAERRAIGERALAYARRETFSLLAERLLAAVATLSA